MKNKFQSFSVLGGALAFASISYAETAVNFSQLPKLVKERNDHAKAATLASQAAEISTPSSLQPFYPTIKAEVGAERFKRETLAEREDPFAGVSAELNIFKGGRDYLQRESLQLGQEEAKVLSDFTYLEELSKAREAYVNIVYAEALLKVLREAQELNDKNLSAASRRKSAGLATNTDLIEFRMKKQMLEQEVESTQLELKQESLTLAILLGYDIQALNDLKWPQNFDVVTFDLRKVPSNRKEPLSFQIEQLETEKRRVDNKIASRWWIPDVDLYGGYALHTMRDSDEPKASDRQEAYVGIKASLTLFDRGDSFRKQRSASLSNEADRLKLKQSQKEAQVDLERALRTLEKNDRLLKGSEESAKYSKQYLSQTLSEYSRGVKNSPDVSSATDKYIEAQTRHLDLQKERLSALTKLFAALGPDFPENQ